MSIKILEPFWLVSCAAALSLTWLLPNHTHPWLAFHSDAWAGLCLAAVAGAVIWRMRGQFNWDSFAISVGVTALIPWIQYLSGLGLFFGVAWTVSSYLLGLLFCFLIGAAWERTSPCQVGDYLFLAVGIAATCSVGLQLHQWFGLEPIGPWTSSSSGTRHFANMWQPNQLASLLLLGLLACGWGFYRNRVGPAVAIMLAMWLLPGIALTESRTAWLNVALLLVVSLAWGWRHLSRRYLVVVTFLAAYFFSWAFTLPWLNESLGASGLPIEYRTASGDLRFRIWDMFISALAYKPMLGYGWGQLAHAQWQMLEQLPHLGTNSLQAHNLILDLILWNGIPVGVGIVVFLGWYFRRIAIRIKTPLQLLQGLFLLVLATHAMLEYPLQYAYFLLPAGLVLGSLSANIEMPTLFRTSKVVVAGFFVVLVAVLSMTIRDYLRVEERFYGLRFEQRRIATTIPRTPPEVIALDQWREYIRHARQKPSRGLQPTELNMMRNVALTFPSSLLMYKMAANLALNDQPDEALQWLRMVCKVNPANQCEAIRREWLALAESHSEIAAIEWPHK